MVPYWDEEFRKKSENTFLEALHDAYVYFTQLSNVGISWMWEEGQAQFEGYEMVERSIEFGDGF